MKRFFLILAVLGFFAGAGVAQTEAGNIMVGGNFSLDITSGSDEGQIGSGPAVELENPTFTTFSLVPRAGYFIQDGLAVGVELGINLEREYLDQPEVTVDGTVVQQQEEFLDQNSAIQFGVFARKYFLDGNFKVFADADLGVAILSGGSEGATDGGQTVEFTELSGFGFGLGVRPGVAFFPTEHLGFDMTVFGFDFTTASVEETVFNDPNTADDDEITTSRETNANVNFNLRDFGINSFRFGVYYFF